MPMTPEAVYDKVKATLADSLNVDAEDNSRPTPSPCTSGSSQW